MRPRAPRETAEQRQQRQRAESDNIRSMQDSLSVRTSMFNRIRMPRVSIATGRTLTAPSLVT